MDWGTFGFFLGGGIIGMMLGSALVNFIPERTAKLVFSSLTCALAVFMLFDKLVYH